MSGDGTPRRRRGRAGRREVVMGVPVGGADARDVGGARSRGPPRRARRPGRAQRRRGTCRLRLRPRRAPVRRGHPGTLYRRGARRSPRAAACVERRPRLRRCAGRARSGSGGTLALTRGVRAVVVGGGIAGLAAAYRLEALGADPTVVERDSVPGGKIRTERVGGFVIEEAPDSFLARKERGIGLCEDLIGRRPENQRTFVLRGRRLHALPEGLTGMIPANLDALERTELLSPEAKARFAMEPEVPALEGDGDESVASFVSRRFGREAYEALVEPLMTGIYGGDGEHLSLRSTFPQLRALELEHGSVLRGLTGGSESGGREPFLSLRSGMDRLVTRLVER